MKILSITVAVVLLHVPSTSAALVPGEPIPSLTLPSIQDGRPMNTSELVGQKLMLHLFASW
ncbi:MAG: hypothetical protein ACR2RV_23585 [Verrucomicrobiales bacterium]